MIRRFNTTTSGGSFDPATVKAVWNKAMEDPGYTIFKIDSCGATLQEEEYGKMTDYGWEIDHIKPVAEGGTDDLNNLQPLHWENNRQKGNNWPHWECKKKN